MPGGIKVTAKFKTRGAQLMVKGQLARAKNLRPALTEFGAYMLLSVDENFRQQGRRNGIGRQWAALSALTVALRPGGQRASPRILQNTGQLRRSTRWAVGGTRVAVGTFDARASDHHQGGRWGRSIFKTITRKVRAHTRKTKNGPVEVKAYTVTSEARIPARPIYIIHRADLVRWKQIEAKWIKRGQASEET